MMLRRFVQIEIQKHGKNGTLKIKVFNDTMLIYHKITILLKSHAVKIFKSGDLQFHKVLFDSIYWSV